MRKHFVFRREERPGEAWLSRFAAGREEAERWYRGEGLADPPTAAECRAALRDHMPELLSHYDHVCNLVGDDDIAHRILSHYRPPPLFSGCSQAVWLGREGPALVRNYDFPLGTVSDGFESTCWSGREVISKAQRPWGGCLDGMNQDGLVASLTFGGSPSQGRGFSIILLLRYVLETCTCVEEAVTTLCRIPVALSQNVVLLDRSGAHATLFLGPDREPAISKTPVCTNHQETVIWHEAAVENLTLEREQVLQAALNDSRTTLETLAENFLRPPLYSRRAAFTTVYTAIYRPAEGRIEYIWPGKRLTQPIGRFETREYTHDYGDLSP
jgi:predicted choloylglycine hydrolase